MRYRILTVPILQNIDMAVVLNQLIADIEVKEQIACHVVSCVHVPALGLVYTVELR